MCDVEKVYYLILFIGMEKREGDLMLSCGCWFRERESRGFNGIERIYCCIMGVSGVVMKVGFKLKCKF